jgi:hypothetical protein
VCSIETVIVASVAVAAVVDAALCASRRLNRRILSFSMVMKGSESIKMFLLCFQSMQSTAHNLSFDCTERRRVR